MLIIGLKDFYKTTEYFGEDIHILRNSVAVNLDGFFNDAPPQYNAWKISSSFSNANAGTFGYENISVNHTTGQITAAPFTHATQKKISSFYVFIKYAWTAAPTQTKTIKVRIQVHDEISAVWMTPSELTLRAGIDKARFGVYARFLDGMIADISGHYGLAWSKGTGAPAGLSIAANGRMTGYSGTTGTTSYPTAIKVVLPSSLTNTGDASPQAEAKITLTPGTQDFTALEIKSASQPGQPASNVLLVADGFTPGDAALFQKFSAEIVHDFTSELYASPWNHLKNSLNFYALFTPGREQGGILTESHVLLKPGSAGQQIFISCSDYVDAIDTKVIRNFTSGKSYTIASTALKRRMPEAAGTPTLNFQPYYGTATACYQLSELISRVGYATKAEYDDASSTFDQKYDAKKLAWTQINAANSAFGFDQTKLNKLVFFFWLRMGNRYALEHADTAWGMSSGGFYRAEDSADPTLSANLNPYRVADKKDLNKLLRGAVGTTIGDTFFDASGNAKEPGGNFLIFMSNVPITLLLGNLVKYTSDNKPYGNYLFTTTSKTTGSSREITGEQVVGAGYRVVYQANDELDILHRSTAIHELSHNFLLDEYAVSAGDGAQARDSDEANLQILSSLRVDTGSSNISGTNIRWGWPRILKIGISTADITPAGAYHKVILTHSAPATTSTAKPKYSPFVVGDVVLLRPRRLISAQYQQTYQIFEIKEMPSANTYHLQYKGGAPFDKSVFQEAPNSGTYNFLMLKPEWKPNSQTEFYTLIHPSVLNLTQPLVLTDAKDQEIQRPRRSVGNLFSSPADVYKIVGLYAGGDVRYDTNIYHPTGFCMMRYSTIGTEPSMGNAMCPVCKYIIVDKMNPLLHPVIDEELDGDYPVKKP